MRLVLSVDPPRGIKAGSSSFALVPWAENVPRHQKVAAMNKDAESPWMPEKCGKKAHILRRGDAETLLTAVPKYVVVDVDEILRRRKWIEKVQRFA